jgi:hypothetical protein
MKRHPIASLILVLSSLLLSACAAEEQAVQKASVDVKSAAVTQTAAVTGAAAKQPAVPNKPAANQPTAEKPAAANQPAPAPAPTGQPASGAKPPAGKVAQVPTDPPPALSVPPGYSYQPRGRRDPFVNPIPKTTVADDDSPKPVIRPDGLPGVLVSEVKLSGIVYSSVATMKKAMLVVGRSTYFAKQGDALFDGVIKEIRPNEVVFALVSATTKQPVNRETVIRTGGSPVTLAGEK